jgi:hypothetical protein
MPFEAETAHMALEIGGESFLNLVVGETHRCYPGGRGRRHD